MCTIYEVKMENRLGNSILLPAEDLVFDLFISIHLLPFLAMNYFRPRAQGFTFLLHADPPALVLLRSSVRLFHSGDNVCVRTCRDLSWHLGECHVRARRDGGCWGFAGAGMYRVRAIPAGGEECGVQ